LSLYQNDVLWELNTFLIAIEPSRRWVTFKSTTWSVHWSLSVFFYVSQDNMVYLACWHLSRLLWQNVQWTELVVLR